MINLVSAKLPSATFHAKKGTENSYLVKAFFKVLSVGSLFRESENYIPLSQLFKLLTELQTEGKITEFDVTRSTLE